MKDAEIAEFAAKLESDTPGNGAVVKWIQHGGGPDESHIIANRAGYLRLAVLFLRASTAPLSAHSDTILELDSSDVIHEESDINFDWLERRETFEAAQYKPTLSDVIYLLGCAMIALSILSLCVVGAFTVVDWIARTF